MLLDLLALSHVKLTVRPSPRFCVLRCARMEQAPFAESGLMLTISNTLRFTSVAALLALAACTTKPKATDETPPIAAPTTGETTSSVQSSVVPGSIQDFRV